MKNAKRLTSLLVALIMVFALGMPALASESEGPKADPPAAPTTGTITIANTYAGEKYTIYKVFDLTYDKTGTGSTSAMYFTDNEALLGLLWNSKEAGKDTYDGWEEGQDPVCPFYKGLPVDDKEGALYVYHIYSGELTSEKEPAGQGWLLSTLDTWKGSTYTDTKEATGNTTVFDGLDFGYYLITTTTGSAVIINSTTPDMTVYDKNDMTPDEPTKTEDKVYVTDGETVTYTSTLDVTNYLNSSNNHNAILNYTANDYWDKGLTFDPSTGIKSVKLFQWIEREITTEEYGKLSDEEKAEIKVVTTGEGETAVKKYYEKNYIETFTEGAIQTTVDGNKTTYTSANKDKYTLTSVTDSETGKNGFVITLPWASYTSTATQVEKAQAEDYAGPAEYDTVYTISDITSFYTSPAVLEIVYEMKVNDQIFENQKSFKADNTMTYKYEREVNGKLTDGGGKEPQTVTVYSLGISLRKTNLGGSTPLPGAEFIVYQDVTENGTTTRYYYQSDKNTLKYTNNKAVFVTGSDNQDYVINWVSAANYADDPAVLALTDENADEQAKKRLAKADELARKAATRLIADNDYDTMEIAGLKPTPAGQPYKIEEVEPPKGYDLPDGPFEVTITEGSTPGKCTFTYSKGSNTEGIKENNANHGNAYSTAEIENNTNEPMPVTGGPGTIALITFGAITFLGAAILLVTRKRMYNQNAV